MKKRRKIALASAFCTGMLSLSACSDPVCVYGPASCNETDAITEQAECSVTDPMTEMQPKADPDLVYPHVLQAPPPHYDETESDEAAVL